MAPPHAAKTEETTATKHSPFFRPSTPHITVTTSTPGGTQQETRVLLEIKEHKSGVLGAGANLINAIVGSGIVGIPYAMQQAGLVTGILLVLFVALLTEKSLRLLVETAKHVNVPSYETLLEACFGRVGFFFVAANMFIMAYGAMTSYLMIVKDTLPFLFGITDVPRRRGILFLISFCVIVPLSSQRDMADLAKTSRLSVTFDMIMVLMVMYASPWVQHLEEEGWNVLAESTLHVDTVFVGLGVLSFAFVCQHSAFIIAGSLENPTKVRWAQATKMALIFCVCLATCCGVSGYVGYKEGTEGNILNNLPEGTFTANLARGLLGTTMLFVYPMESFVAWHVCVVLFFKGRWAHEGEDAAILNRRDRRWALTLALYVLALVPALLFEDVGTVLAATGCVGGSCLSYIGPGASYLGVHGADFLELVHRTFGPRFWKVPPRRPRSGSITPTKPVHPSMGTPLPAASIVALEKETPRTRRDSEDHQEEDSWCIKCLKTILWYLLCMPLWCSLAAVGARVLVKHEEEMQAKSPHPLRIGNVHHADSSKSRAVQMTARRQRRGEVDEEAAPLITRQGSLHLIGQRTVLPPAASSYQKSLTGPAGNDGDEDDDDLAATKKKLAVALTPSAPPQAQQEEEEDPQADPPRVVDFLIAIGYMLFGLVAVTAGLVSILAEG